MCWVCRTISGRASPGMRNLGEYKNKYNPMSYFRQKYRNKFEWNLFPVWKYEEHERSITRSGLFVTARQLAVSHPSNDLIGKTTIFCFVLAFDYL